jgi:hypothetical protein
LKAGRLAQRKPEEAQSAGAKGDGHPNSDTEKLGTKLERRISGLKPSI